MKKISSRCLKIRFMTTLLPLLIVIMLSCLKELRAEDNSSNEKIFNPEGSSLLYVYGGYGYYRWKMMSMESLVDMFSSGTPSTGLRFDHDATPYTVKKYGFKSNLLIFSVGLDYLGDKFGLPTESDSEKDLQDRENKKAKQLRYLSGISFGKMSFEFNVTRRDFNSTITSEGYMPLSGPIQPIYYYTEHDGLKYLNAGDETAWYTTYTDYEGKLAWKNNGGVLEFGARYVRYDAPTELRISSGGSDGDVLMYTENKMVSLFMGAGGLAHIAGDFYFHFYIPVNMAGYYYAESDYFEVKNKKPFSKDTLSFTTSSAGNFSLAYILSHLKLEAGMDYGMYFSQLMLTDAKLKQQVTYPDSISGSPVTVNAGDSARIEAKRLEFFWGFYLHASAYF